MASSMLLQSPSTILAKQSGAAAIVAATARMAASAKSSFGKEHLFEFLFGGLDFFVVADLALVVAKTKSRRKRGVS